MEKEPQLTSVSFLEERQDLQQTNEQTRPTLKRSFELITMTLFPCTFGRRQIFVD